MALIARICVAAAALLMASQLAAQVRDIPRATWEPIYFESINKFTSRAGLQPLRDQSLGADSIEIRVWIGFGIGPMEVIAIRRDGAQWAARYGSAQLWQPDPVKVGPVTPQSGWQDLWQRLTQLGILILPDQSRLPKSGETPPMTDGVSYVVEISADRRYRTYMYGNPEHANWPEARKMVEIIKLLRAELMGKP